MMDSLSKVPRSARPAPKSSTWVGAVSMSGCALLDECSFTRGRDDRRRTEGSDRLRPCPLTLSSRKEVGSGETDDEEERKVHVIDTGQKLKSPH